MDSVKEWLRMQKEFKGFYWMLGFMLAVTAALSAEYVLLGYQFLKILRCLLLLWGLFLIAWIDGHSGVIPNRILAVLFGIRTVLLLAECVVYREYWMTFIASCFIGFLAAGGMFLFCFVASKGAMGAGDVKLMALLGYFIGSRFIFGTIFLTVTAAAVYNVIRLLLRKVSLRQEVPFAPFVLAGTLLMMGLGI